MAPVPESSTITTLLTSLLRRLPSASASPFTSPSSHLHARGERPPENPGEGVTPFEKVPNKAVFSLFGLIGVFFVVTGIWFFFHAKNGGFYFRENDWEEYKSTVLRRKGPNGTTLSGGTRSTDLGGGSVVHDMSEKGESVWGRIRGGRGGRKKLKRYQDFDEETAYMGSEGGSSLGSELSEMKREKQKAHKEFKEKKSRFRRNKNKRRDDEETVVTEALSLSHAGVEEDVEPEVRDAVRAYRHEKPARVGGLNKPAEGSAWDGSTEATESDLGLMSHREPTPTSTPTKKIRKERNDNYTGGNTNSTGIRKVVSTSQPNHHSTTIPPPPSTTTPSSFWTRTNEDVDRDRERERIKAEARRLQEKGRAASQSAHSRSQSHGRRDFSFQHGDDTSTVVSSALTSTTSSTEDREREARRAARREERERRRAERAEEERSGSPRKKMSVPGSYYEESEVGSNVSGDTGTKSYPCVIPGLSVKKESGGTTDDYREERRKRRANNAAGAASGGGYRRGRRDSLE